MSEPEANHPTGRIQKAQAQFLAHLEELTRLKRARWVRSRSQPGRVLCRVAGEIIVFQASNGKLTRGGKPVLVDPDRNVGGIVCEFRNWTWLWLIPLEDGQKLLGLLRKAKINDRAFVKWKANAYRSGVIFLEDALSRKKG